MEGEMRQRSENGVAAAENWSRNKQVDTSGLSDGLRLRWENAALGCMVVTIGSVAALAVVASVNKADALSTVALAVAVIAFIAQIVTFIGQSEGAQRQGQRGERIFGETMAVLARVETSAQETRQLIGSQYDKLLNRLLVTTDATVESLAAAQGRLEPETLKDELANRLTSAVEAERRWASGSLPRAEREAEPDKTMLDVYHTYPSPDVVQALVNDGVAGLSSAGQMSLELVAREYLAALSDGNTRYTFQLPADEGVRELVTRGILQPLRGHERGQHAEESYRLTPMGRAAIRLVTPVAGPPSYVREVIPWLSREDEGATGREDEGATGRLV